MFEQAFKNIDDVLWKEAGARSSTTEQTSWLLFLKYLDSLEQDKADEAALHAKKYAFLLGKQHFIKILKAPGRGGVVIKNTFLSNTDNASVSLRKLLLESCNLHTVLRLAESNG